MALVLAASPVAACRQALALGLDISRSVDESEYRLQIDGVIAALTAPAVRDILFRQPDAPIRVLVYEWSGPADQHIIVPWSDLRTEADLARVTGLLSAHDRSTGAETTAIGSALLFGYRALAGQGDCWRRTLDLSGDGPSNTGPAPATTRPDSLTVNALVIGSDNLRGDDARLGDVKELSGYFRENVIGGPDAFVEVALGYPDYANALERKLLRELSSLVIGYLAPDP